MSEDKPIKGGARSAARLAAVQALFQIEASNAKAVFVVKEFLDHRLGQIIDEDQFAKADADFFSDIVVGTDDRFEELNTQIKECLSQDWTMERIESVARAILRAGAYELIARPDIPTNVIINEYVDVAKAFFDDSTPGFVNGVLDRIAKQNRN